MEIPPSKNNLVSPFPISKVPIEQNKNVPFPNFSTKTVVPASPVSSKNPEFNQMSTLSIPNSSQVQPIPPVKSIQPTSSVLQVSPINSTNSSSQSIFQDIPQQIPQPVQQQIPQSVQQQIPQQIPQPVQQSEQIPHALQLQILQQSLESQNPPLIQHISPSTSSLKPQVISSTGTGNPNNHHQKSVTIIPAHHSSNVPSNIPSNVVSPFPDIQSSFLAKPQSPGHVEIFPKFKHRSFISFLPSEEKHPMKMRIFYDQDPQKSFYTNCLNYDQEKIKNELNSCLAFLVKKGLQNPDFFRRILLNISPKSSVTKYDKNKQPVEKRIDGFVSDVNSNSLFFYKNKKELNMKYIVNNEQYEIIEGGIMFVVGKEPLNGESGKINPGSILLFGNYYVPELHKQMYFRSVTQIVADDNIINAFLSIVVDKSDTDKDSVEWALQSRTYFKSKNSGRRGYMMHSTVTY